MIYHYNKTAVSAYNDADCCKIDSQATNIGFELRYKSRPIIKFDAVADSAKRVKYFSDTHKRRYGVNINPSLVSQSTTLGAYWTPLTFIDLQSVGTSDYDLLETHSGLSNANAELELILTNAVSGGTYSTSTKLYVVLCYYEFAMWNTKNKVLEFKK
jgi:hypothetical protein